MKPANDGRHGADIRALMRALPISGLKPQCLASIGGLIDVPKDPFGALEGLIGSYGPLENLAVNS